MSKTLDAQTEDKVRDFTGTINDANGAVGSAFVADIDNNIATIVTNQHVITAADKETITVTLRDAATNEYFTVEAPIIVESESSKTQSSESMTDQLDAAVLKVDLNNAKPVNPETELSSPPAPGIATFAEIKAGETVFPIGQPHESSDIEVKAFKTDFIIGGDKGQKGLGNGYNIGYRDDEYAHGNKDKPDAVEKGMSGGPTVNENGDVIGINGQHAYPLWQTAHDQDVLDVFEGTKFIPEDSATESLGERLDSYNASIHPSNILKEFPELSEVITISAPAERLSLSDNYVEAEPSIENAPQPVEQQPYDKDVIDALRDAQIDLQSGQWKSSSEGQTQVTNNLEYIIEQSHENGHFDVDAIITQDKESVLAVQSFLGMAGTDATGTVDTATLEKLTEFRHKYGVDSNASVITREDAEMMNALQSARELDRESEKLDFTDTDFANVAASPIYDSAQDLQESKNTGAALF